MIGRLRAFWRAPSPTPEPSGPTWPESIMDAPAEPSGNNIDALAELVGPPVPRPEPQRVVDWRPAGVARYPRGGRTS